MIEYYALFVFLIEMLGISAVVRHQPSAIWNAILSVAIRLPVYLQAMGLLS